MSGTNPNAVRERASIANPGAYKLWFTWPCCKGTKNATLAEIFEMENGARALIEISEWSKTDANTKNYILEFMECDPKRKEVFQLVREDLRAEVKKLRKAARGTGGNWSQSQQGELNWPGQ